MKLTKGTKPALPIKELSYKIFKTGDYSEVYTTDPKTIAHFKSKGYK